MKRNDVYFHIWYVIKINSGAPHNIKFQKSAFHSCPRSGSHTILFYEGRNGIDFYDIAYVEIDITALQKIYRVAKLNRDYLLRWMFKRQSRFNLATLYIHWFFGQDSYKNLHNFCMVDFLDFESHSIKYLYSSHRNIPCLLLNTIKTFRYTI